MERLVTWTRQGRRPRGARMYVSAALVTNTKEKYTGLWYQKTGDSTQDENITVLDDAAASKFACTTSRQASNGS